MPQHGTIHDSLYNAFSFGPFAAYVMARDRPLMVSGTGVQQA